VYKFTPFVNTEFFEVVHYSWLYGAKEVLEQHGTKEVLELQ